MGPHMDMALHLQCGRKSSILFGSTIMRNSSSGDGGTLPTCLRRVRSSYSAPIGGCHSAVARKYRLPYKSHSLSVCLCSLKEERSAHNRLDAVSGSAANTN